MGRVGRAVLVTGVSRDLGRRFARAVATDPAVERVIGVDVVPPRGDLGDVSFVRADIRNPVIAKIIAKEDVDTVVHMSVIATPGSAGGRNTMKELNVIGTMQLLAACQKAPGLQALVVKSTTTVYGASSRDPAMFTEDMEPRRAPRAGYAKDVAEIEGYVRGFGRRRPDVCVLMLSQAIRRLQRPSVPMPAFAVGSLGSALRSARVADFSPEQLAFLTYGRGVDTRAMRQVLRFEPAFTSAEAFADFGSA